MAKAVLIVDDNTAIRKSLCAVFKLETDFEVCGEATNGLEAIEKAQELRPDLIVLDLSLPEVNGIEVSRVVRRLMPAVPIIMFSAYADVLTEKEAHSAGVSALISKDEHVSVLITKARSLVYRAVA